MRPIGALRDLIYSRNIHIASVLILLFMGGLTFSSYESLSTFIHSLTMAVSAAVLIAYGPYGYEALISKSMTRERQLILGITTSWLGAFLRSAFIVHYRVTDGLSPLQSNWVQFFNALIMIGGVLHITAPNAIRGKVPPKGWALLAGTVGVGITIFWVLIAVGARIE